MTDYNIIYHHHDQDGFLAAAIAEQFLWENTPDPAIKFICGNYSEPVPHTLLRGAKYIYLLDYSLSVADMETYSNKLIWIDHHVSAINKCENIPLAGCRKVGTSGAMLSWKYFYGQTKPPLCVELVNDRDVWLWQLGEDTAAFHEATMESFTDYDYWHNLLPDDILTREEVNRGYVILKHINLMVDKVIQKYAYEERFEGYSAVFLNSPLEISGQLHRRLREKYEHVEIAIIYTYKRTPASQHNTLYHLYTNKDYVDVSKIAEKFGGGGHKQAAGFYVNGTPLV